MEYLTVTVRIIASRVNITPTIKAAIPGPVAGASNIKAPAIITRMTDTNAYKYISACKAVFDSQSRAHNANTLNLNGFISVFPLLTFLNFFTVSFLK
jgi:hypothetical protein